MRQRAIRQDLDQAVIFAAFASKRKQLLALRDAFTSFDS
jgi:hypothetical protein